MIHKILPFLFFLFISNAFYSQLAVTNDMSPEEYVQDVLLGGGVVASNITFNGNPGSAVNSQCGFFTSNEGVIDLCDGIILASGDVTGALGPNNSGGFTLGADNPINGDADLELLIPGFPVNDVAVLEFDFVPEDDVLTFSYIFGSDEYLEFVNGGFNDVFGFFLCGPGISGPYSTPDNTLFPDGSDNIAVLPSGDVVSIDNVNDVVNSEYYVINGDGTNEPYASDDFYVQYDGLTVVLTATANVVPGETYHIKMAIADAGDTALDSGVFLEGGSFSSGLNGIDAVTYSSLGLVEASELCDSGYFYIGREGCVLDSLWYEFVYTGSADYGTDYNPLPLDTILPEGVEEIIFPMYAISDGIDEGMEVMEVLIYSSETGAEGSFIFLDTLTVNIVDNYTFPLDAETVSVYCPVDSANIFAVPMYPGVPEYDITWTQNGVVLGDETQLLVPVPEIQYDSTYYNITVMDGCGMFSEPDSVWIVNSIPSHPVVEVGINSTYCRGIEFPLYAEIDHGTAPFTYQWSDGGTTSPNLVTPDIDTEYTVIVTDGCGREAEGTGTLIMPATVTIDEDVPDYICIGEDLELSPMASGGRSPYYYTWGQNPVFGDLEYDNWTGNGTIGNVVQFAEDENIAYLQLEVRDYCQRMRDTLGISNPFDFPVYFTDTVTVLNCMIPNVITPNGDDINALFEAEELLANKGTLFIYDRWGKLMSESSEYFWDPKNSPDGTYYWVIIFADGTEQKKGHFTILR